MTAENCLWGAPRIHGELLKLGIAMSDAPSRAICAADRRPGKDLGDILREPLRWPDIYLAGDVRGTTR